MEISFNVLKNGRRERGAKCGSILLNFYEIREKGLKERDGERAGGRAEQ